MAEFLFLASVFLLAAVIAVPIAARLGLGSVLGYLLAGVVIGPGLGLVANTTDLQHFAEFGVVMMLFLIGLELEPRALWDMRHRLIGLGGMQVILTMFAVMAGANDIVRELFDSSLRAGRYVLENIGLTEFEANAAETLFYQHDRHTVRELAELWDPNIPSAQNAAYIARAKELEKELEASLLSALENANNDAA
jgi:hypothetical protein